MRFFFHGKLYRVVVSFSLVFIIYDVIFYTMRKYVFTSFSSLRFIVVSFLSPFYTLLREKKVLSMTAIWNMTVKVMVRPFFNESLTPFVTSSFWLSERTRRITTHAAVKVEWNVYFRVWSLSSSIDFYFCTKKIENNES